MGQRRAYPSYVPTLLLIRHASAESFAPSDRERSLTARGRADAQELGRWLAGLGISPDQVHVSAAVRTRQTAEELLTAAAWTVAPTEDEGLYSADEEYVFGVLQGSDPDVGTVAIVGHNPTMEILSQLIDDGTGPASADLTPGFPTAAVAVIDIDDWSQLGPMTGRIRAFHVGRG